jgi:hypothetical protein
MSTYSQIAWFPLAGGLTLLGLILSWLAWRRRGVAAGLRGVAWSLLPLAAYLTGAIKMLWQMGTAIGDFASSFVFSPRVWSGVIVAAAAGVLFVVSGSLRRGRARKARASTPDTGATAGPGQGGASAPTKALKPAKNKPPADDDLADVADILRRHNIH